MRITRLKQKEEEEKINNHHILMIYFKPPGKRKSEQWKVCVVSDLQCVIATSKTHTHTGLPLVVRTLVNVMHSLDPETNISSRQPQKDMCTQTPLSGTVRIRQKVSDWAR